MHKRLFKKFIALESGAPQGSTAYAAKALRCICLIIQVSELTTSRRFFTRIHQGAFHEASLKEKGKTSHGEHVQGTEMPLPAKAMTNDLCLSCRADFASPPAFYSSRLPSKTDRRRGPFLYKVTKSVPIPLHRGDENKANTKATVQSDGRQQGLSQKATPHHLPGKRHSSKVTFVPHNQPLASSTLFLTSCTVDAGSALTYIISTPPGVTEEDVCSLLDEESVVHSGSETESLLQGSLFGEVFL